MESRLTPADLYVDLLPQRAFLSYAQSPGSFREEVLAHLRRHKRFTCVVDEIQKLPALLDEVHELIESTPVTFVLTGSSARKLRSGSSNLLAGRAYTYYLFPLTFEELGDEFVLEKALNHGTLPPIWAHPGESPREFLRSYAETFWRTHQGLEVDLLITRGQKILAAAEIKSASVISHAHLRGLRGFLEHHHRVPAFTRCPDRRERLTEEGITVLGWQRFITDTLPTL